MESAKKTNNKRSITVAVIDRMQALLDEFSSQLERCETENLLICPQAAEGLNDLSHRLETLHLHLHTLHLKCKCREGAGVFV